MEHTTYRRQFHELSLLVECMQSQTKPVLLLANELVDLNQSMTCNRRNSPRFQGENFHKNLELVQKIGEIAERKGYTPSQLALAWVLAQGEDIVPIPGTKRRQYLEENAAAADIVLTPEDLQQINEVAPQGAAAGARYTEEMMKSVAR